jgi:prepilin-type N-terminal cleavage/methylation domain-containing protein
LIAKMARRAIRHGERGFTLLELLLVLAILAILALIVVPNFGWLTGSGQEEVCLMESRLLKSATMVYASENGICPDSLDDLAIYLEDVDDVVGSYSFEDDYPDCKVTQDSCP